MSLIVTLIVGGVVGWLASIVMRTKDSMGSWPTSSSASPDQSPGRSWSAPWAGTSRDGSAGGSSANEASSLRIAAQRLRGIDGRLASGSH